MNKLAREIETGSSMEGFGKICVCAVRELGSSEQEIGSQILSVLASMETESFQDVTVCHSVYCPDVCGNRRVAKTHNCAITGTQGVHYCGFPIAMKAWMGTIESLPSHVCRTSVFLNSRTNSFQVGETCSIPVPQSELDQSKVEYIVVELDGLSWSDSDKMGAGAVMWGRKTAHLFPLRGRSRTSVRDTVFWREIPKEGGIKSRETEIAVKGPVGSGSGSPRPSNGMCWVYWCVRRLEASRILRKGYRDGS
ncbi:hypothetical protein F2Q68_00043750 [Brassica cretica]|uniref:Uncharacterized protein n=1 Tax=Brassica cretica TaxID=69181 RepID=A0A8S9LK63_BRACR|nr:hypothetical protein F2Q68_00043750 [Brassica cretica]